jgi:hypothetical protein
MIDFAPNPLPRESSFDQWQGFLDTPPSSRMPSRCSSTDLLRSSSVENAPFMPPCDPEDFVDRTLSGDDGFLRIYSAEYSLTAEVGDHRVKISGIDPHRTPDQIKGIISGFGPCEFADTHPGIAIVRFWRIDSAFAIRAAQIVDHGQPWIVNFFPPDEEANRSNPPNNGTIVLFRLPPGVTDEQLTAEFSQYGEIREIRRAPQKETPRFIEFIDLRAAQKAKDEGHGKMVFGAKLSIEFSLPGGTRKCAPLPAVDRSPMRTIVVERPVRTELSK